MADAPNVAEQRSAAGRDFDPQLPPPCDPYGCMALWHDRDDSAPIIARPTITSITPARGLVGSTINVTINGTGFRANMTTVNAGAGISVTSITVNSSTQLTANFNVDVNAAGGNRAVTITVGGRTSTTSKNFFVQIPKRLVLQRTDPLQTPVNGDVKDLAGTLRARNQCGVYRNYGFFLMDQGGERILESFTIGEEFASYNGPFTTPTAVSALIPANTIVPDIQNLTFSYPRCLYFNENEYFLIGYTVYIGSESFELTTINSVQRGDYSGTKRVDLTNVVP